MNAPSMESPPALGAEGHSIAVGAIALAIYAQSNAGGNTETPFISPRDILDQAATLMLDATTRILAVLDIVDADADAEDDDPAEADGDDTDAAFTEWHTRGRHKLAGGKSEPFDQSEDAEDDDPREDDDPDCEHDGREPDDGL